MLRKVKHAYLPYYLRELASQITAYIFHENVPSRSTHIHNHYIHSFPRSLYLSTRTFHLGSNQRSASTSSSHTPSPQNILNLSSSKKENNLDLKDLHSKTRPALSAARATRLDVLGVVGGDDVLARLRVVHDGLGVREEAVEGPVEEAGGDEGVDVADGEAV